MKTKVCLAIHAQTGLDFAGLKWNVLPAVAALLFTSCISTRALSLLSEPTLTKAPLAPLAAVLQLRTDTASRVEVSVNDGIEVWDRAFYDFASVHSVPLFGFKPGRTNQISVRVYDQNRNLVTAPEPLLFVTDPLPTDFPVIKLLQHDLARMEPGYTLFRVEIGGNAYAYVVIVDSAGEVVWYGAAPSTADVRQLANGSLFMPSTNQFVEMNLLGETVNTWPVRDDLPINDHDGVPTDHGTILYLSDANESIDNYPTTVWTPDTPLVTSTITFQRVVEIAKTNAAVLKVWSPVDVLDPRRISYLVSQNSQGWWDSEHSDAVIEDPVDDSLIVSMRHQNAVLKFSRATGKLRWILGPHEGWGPQWQPYLLTPVGTPFAWPYGQHAPILTPEHTLMIYDDGNFRAMPFDTFVADEDNYSRAVEYRIDEQTMEVSQVWEYGRTNVTERLFTGWEGNAEPLSKTRNVLIDFAAISQINGLPPNPDIPTATMARIKEVTRASVPETVFDLGVSMYDNPNAVYLECSIYRSRRIPDLYGHPPAPVGDLTVSYESGYPRVEFSGDPARTYLIEASTDLRTWMELGAATENLETPGEYRFDEPYAREAITRYYRVVAQ